jgi:L-ascorbate metabolism protein UlaG (beta-lactamase superfamily)
MRITKYGHSCVRLEADGAVLVIDPGVYTESAALDGVDGVLITHEHADHVDVDALAEALAKRLTVTVHTHPSVASKLDALAGVVTSVESGQTFEAAGMTVRAYGGWHAEIHPDVPRVPNLGFLVNDTLYHPGDSFDVPTEAQVDTLFVPVSAPWLKLAESVEFVRAVAPRRAFALHDAVLSDAGHTITSGLMAKLAGCDYARLLPGSTVN